jgi:hypothetical protein
MTTNQLYHGLNTRFDRRVSRLYRLGFRLEGNDYGSFMVKKDNWTIKTVPMPMIMHACNADYLRFLASQLLSRGRKRSAQSN